MKSPTQQTLRYLRAQGFVVDILEHWQAFAKRRKDLYGFGDVMATGNGMNVIVQTTSWSNVGARRKKILSDKCRVAALSWIVCGGQVWVHGWKKIERPGKRNVYELKEIRMTEEDFSESS